MIKYLVCFTAMFATINANEGHDPLSEITLFDGKTGDFPAGNKEEIFKIQAFPLEKYEIYHVPGLGSFHIDYLNDTIKRTLSEGHIWESNIVELIKKYAHQGNIVIDIGSHIGTHLVSMSSAVGNEGLVIGFEPQIKLFAELVKNMEFNQCHNVRAYRCAIGKEFREIQMEVAHTENEGGTAIGSGGDFARLIPLDALHLDRVSLMKIDVEGYEDEVLKGAQETIKKFHPTIIIELMDGSKELETKRDATIMTLENMGYKVSKLWGWDWFATPN